MLQTPLDVGKMARPESAPRTKILIVEKHAAVRRALRKRLSATPDLDVLAAVQDPAAALPYLNRSSDCLAAPDVILLGLQSGSDEELFATLSVVRQMAHCPTAIIVLVPYADEVDVYKRQPEAQRPRCWCRRGPSTGPVSYTHLDVYKRQNLY